MAAERYDDARMPVGSVWEIDDGWDVLGVDGDKLGLIEDVEPDYVVVARGFLRHTVWYVPISAIRDVDPGIVYLNVTRHDIEARGWHVPPQPAVTNVTTQLPQIAPVSGGDFEPVETLDRRLADEDIVIDRQPAAPIEALDSARADDALISEDPRAFAHLSLAIPIYGEVAVVRKRPTVYEMLHIVRGRRERRRSYQDVVRREDVTVTRDHTVPYASPELAAAERHDSVVGVQ